jgi:hypothetical protein
MEDLRQIFLDYEKNSSKMDYSELREKIFSLFVVMQRKPQEVIQERIESLERDLKMTHQGNEYYDSINAKINELEDLKGDFYVA